MPDGKRLWRTQSGDLVEDGHKDALLLAYGPNDALSAEDAELLSGKEPEPEPEPEPEKRAPKPVDKQAAPARNK